MEFVVVVGILFAIGGIGWISDVISERKNSRELIENLRRDNHAWLERTSELEDRENNLEKRETLFKQLFIERTQNYPVVGRIWSELIEITESERERALRYKSHPALVAAEEVKSIKREKRELVKELTLWKYKAANYEAIYPWLVDELEEDIVEDVSSDIFYSVYSEREREDPVTQFICPDDFRKLSTSERNQLALERYWQRGQKTKWMIGKMYERYVGYLYEKDGWDVQYFGIKKRYEDLGRDLIAIKDQEVQVVQCKNWSRFKTIYENHVFQLFGTTFSMRKDSDMKGKKITPVFYTTTALSDTAAEFARLLGMKVKQNEKLEKYPCIKCHNAKSEKIYHLPFDQQYDTTKVIPRRGDFYAMTVVEAEKAGFRRAFRWSGSK